MREIIDLLLICVLGLLLTYIPIILILGEYL